MDAFEPKTFDCGCVVTLESDEEDSTRTSDVFNLERCSAHSRDATDTGPIDAYIASFKPATPVRAIPPLTEAEKKRMAPKPVSKKLQARRDYYSQHRDDYGKYELQRLKRLLSVEKDPAKVERLKKRIEKREPAIAQ